MTVDFQEKSKMCVLAQVSEFERSCSDCLGWQHVEVVDVLPCVHFSGDSTIRWYSLMPTIPGIKVALRRKRLAPVCPSSIAAAIRSMQSEHTSQRKNGLCTNASCILYTIICIYTYESCCVCTWCIKYI